MRQDAVQEMLGHVFHPAGGARGTGRAGLAGERDQEFVAAAVAANTQEALPEQTAREVGTELPLDEEGQSRAAVAAGAGLGQQRLQVLADRPVKEGALGVASPVGRRQEPRFARAAPRGRRQGRRRDACLAEAGRPHGRRHLQAACQGSRTRSSAGDGPTARVRLDGCPDLGRTARGCVRAAGRPAAVRRAGTRDQPQAGLCSPNGDCLPTPAGATDRALLLARRPRERGRHRNGNRSGSLGARCPTGAAAVGGHFAQ